MKYKYVIDTKLVAYYLIQRGRPISDIFEKIAQLVYGLQKKGDIYLCFDIGHSDFREGEQSYYKGHRRAQLAKKSVAEQEAHKLFNQRYEELPALFKGLGVHVVAVPGVEADDLASMISKDFENQPDVRVTLITGDYDWLHMVVSTNNVRLYDFPKEVFWHKKDIVEKYGINSRREFSVRKSITGDKSDNIKFVRNMAEVKGAKLFESIREMYDDPTDDQIIYEIEGYMEENKGLSVHEMHVADKRTTVREAFMSNMRIADPFTNFNNVTLEQEDQIEAVLLHVLDPLEDFTTINMRFIEVFNYPLTLSPEAMRVYGVK